MSRFVFYSLRKLPTIIEGIPYESLRIVKLNAADTMASSGTFFFAPPPPPAMVVDDDDSVAAAFVARLRFCDRDRIDWLIKTHDVRTAFCPTSNAIWEGVRASAKKNAGPKKSDPRRNVNENRINHRNHDTEKLFQLTLPYFSQ